MQPLSYQMTEITCWVTSMLNGIYLLVGRDKILSKTYLALHGLLKDDGSYYYQDKDFAKYKKVIEKVGNNTGLKIIPYRDEEVETAIQKLNFDRNKRVAICDVGNADHCILIVGEHGEGAKGRWLHCFDPYWENIIRNKDGSPQSSTNPDKYTFHDEIFVNVKIREDHLLKRTKIKKGRTFKIGKDMRFLTVMESN